MGETTEFGSPVGSQGCGGTAGDRRRTWGSSAREGAFFRGGTSERTAQLCPGAGLAQAQRGDLRRRRRPRLLLGNRHADRSGGECWPVRQDRDLSRDCHPGQPVPTTPSTGAPRTSPRPTTRTPMTRSTPGVRRAPGGTASGTRPTPPVPTSSPGRLPGRCRVGRRRLGLTSRRGPSATTTTRTTRATRARPGRARATTATVTRATQGDQSDQGDQGDLGDQGDQGDQGDDHGDHDDQGDHGDQGDQGDDQGTLRGHGGTRRRLPGRGQSG